MSNERDDVEELHVETAPFPQTIECPQCDAEMRFLIESTDIGGTRCEECGVDIIYVHDRRGETTDDTEQQTLVTDGGAEQRPTDLTDEHVAESVGDVPICPGCGMAAHITHGEICAECFNRRERWLGGGPLRVVADDGQYHDTPLCPGLRDDYYRWQYWRDESAMYADLAGDLDKCVRCDSYRMFGFDHYDEDDQGTVVGHA